MQVFKPDLGAGYTIRVCPSAGPGLILRPYFTFELSLLLVFVLGLRVFSVPLFSLPPQKPTFQITI